MNVPIKAPSIFRHVNTREIQKINITDFREDILNSDIIIHPHMTVSLLSHQYFRLQAYSNQKQKWHQYPDKGFINTDILSLKHLEQKYERVWHSEISAINQSIYLAAVNDYNFLLEQSRHRHYCAVIAENDGNPKALSNTFQILCINLQLT